MLDPRGALESELVALGTDSYCATASEIARDQLSLLLPPEDISTKECAERYRYLPNPEGTGKRLYDRSLTPYMDGPQDALDDQRIRTVVVVGPGRSGKSIAGENHLFRRLRNGPLTDALIYMPGKTDIDSYADKEFADFFSAELHPEIAAKIGKRTTDNKRTLKKVLNRRVQLFSANPGNLKQRQAPLIMATEVDGFRTTVRSSFWQQATIRGRAYGNQFKLYIESHPDAGWTGGSASVWAESNRGLWFWPCPHCDDWSSPHPLAPKGMVMKLVYERDDELDFDDMLDQVEASAALACPHCGGVIEDEHKRQMNLAGRWVFDGQMITPDGTVSGQPRGGETAGYWVHGTMSPFVTFGKLAREYVAALVFFEKTRKPERLREVTVKSLGEVYEGAGGGAKALSPERLRERATEECRNRGFLSGTLPDEVRFVTAAIDMGRHKADVKIKGWDLETRSWVIDRFTITATARGHKPDFYNRQADWLVLRDQVLRRAIPFADDPGQGLRIAGVAIDNSDGHVTHRAREFARQMLLTGESGVHGYRIRLVKGQSSRTAPEVGEGRKIIRDDQGKAIEPPVVEFTFNADKLKAIIVDRLAISEDGPGYVRWASDIAHAEFDELCGEVMIDGKWERRGANESLDLEVQNEVVRIKLGVDRREINWDLRPPEWARPVMLSAVEETRPAARKLQPTALERMAELNRR